MAAVVAAMAVRKAKERATKGQGRSADRSFHAHGSSRSLVGPGGEPPPAIAKTPSQRRPPENLGCYGHQGHHRVAVKFRLLRDNPRFQLFIIIVILVAGIQVGITTYNPTSEPMVSIMETLDSIILVIFIAEIVIKFIAEGKHPQQFFTDNWNVFDFLIVVVGLMPFGGNAVTALRLVRLLRVLKLVRALPKLRVLVMGLLKSMSSIAYIGLLLFMLFYLYAVLGVSLFGANDPVHLGTLHIAFLTLFRCATLEDWTDVMYTGANGCEGWGYGGREEFCVNSSKLPLMSTLYFCSFVVLANMMILNLFIGVITGSMAEAKVVLEEELQKELEEKEKLRRALMGLDDDDDMDAGNDDDDAEAQINGILDNIALIVDDACDVVDEVAETVWELKGGDLAAAAAALENGSVMGDGSIINGTPLPRKVNRSPSPPPPAAAGPGPGADVGAGVDAGSAGPGAGVRPSPPGLSLAAGRASPEPDAAVSPHTIAGLAPDFVGRGPGGAQGVGALGGDNAAAVAAQSRARAAASAAAAGSRTGGGVADPEGTLPALGGATGGVLRPTPLPPVGAAADADAHGAAPVSSRSGGGASGSGSSSVAGGAPGAGAFSQTSGGR